MFSKGKCKLKTNYMKQMKQINYESPFCTAIEVKPQTILCQSGGNDSMNPYNIGNGGFY